MPRRVSFAKIHEPLEVPNLLALQTESFDRLIGNEKWQERPLAVIVTREGAEVTPSQLRDFLDGKVAKWWLPERWCFVPEVPKTSVGKFDKKVLRAQHAAGVLTVVEV